MDNATVADKNKETRRASLAKARQVLANKKAAERERIFAKSGGAPPNSLPLKAAAMEFEGLTVTECCDDCSPKGCIISGAFYCAHPMKAGLQHKEKNDHEALKRFKRAKAVLNDAKLNLQQMTE